ncbi:hypothetical protein EUX98_g2792 [Antrodiella citrinella]|uniref:t-SNARE coiled-coil homology domain-containing protein n=1 Tax=Antrodiella citrinella TaxID=2447956 RepID=A0A4S4MY62_9APHY|nr:hypothetical protein EUX98_g2792 [Antrodiella citrinella]
MPLQTQEQIIHDRVNLGRLVKSLERTVTGEEWQQLCNDTHEPTKQAWIKVQGTLHKVKYARKMLRSVESNANLGDPSTSAGRYQVIRDSLDRLESALLEVDKRVTLKRSRPEPLLPTLPIPEPPTPKASLPPIDVDTADAEVPLSPGGPSAALSAQDLLLSPSDTIPSTAAGEWSDGNTTNLPTSRTSLGPLAPASTGAILQNSRAIQEELSEQLAQMATQLKRNALHFSNTLEKDKAVVLESQEKIERNYDVMTKERIRLRDHHSKSWGTTWITILSIAIAIIGFFLTFFIIRLT